MGPPAARMTLAEFLAWEEAESERHEFHRGEVTARTAGRSHKARYARLSMDDVFKGVAAAAD